ncbi:MAG: flagellar hook capping FlgD N-terminal domain-containing protein [Bryobacteraceae bacterium]|jgi:flagellar basal-body rod modification protein FlgD
MLVTNSPDQAAAAATNSPSSDTSSSPSSSNPLGDEQTFLQLLVSQIQNQDPLNPTDSTQFVSQLAQFSSLEQLIGINQGVSTLDTDAAPATSSTTPTTPSTSN